MRYFRELYECVKIGFHALAIGVPTYIIVVGSTAYTCQSLYILYDNYKARHEEEEEQKRKYWQDKEDENRRRKSDKEWAKYMAEEYKRRDAIGRFPVDRDVK